jgi:hypothetical protein
MKKILKTITTIICIACLLPLTGAYSIVHADEKTVVYLKSDYERLNKVINHVENVLEYGRMTNPDVPLLPDGINTLTGGPVVWQYPNRTIVPISDMANQQNFLRALVALSIATGNNKYKNEAVNITRYFLDNYVDENGLFIWGGHNFINLETLEVQSAEGAKAPHELKNHLPYYDLFFEVDRDKTIKYIGQMWTAHIISWTGLDMNRHGSYDVPYDPNVFTQPIPNDVVDVSKLPILPMAEGSYLPFINAGTDLAYAALTLYDKTGDTLAKNWAEFLMRQYHLASNPETGMTVYQFKSTPVTKPLEQCMVPSYTNSGCGDRAARQFRDFGPIAKEGNVAWKNTQSMYVDGVLTRLAAAKDYGIDYFVDWSKQYLEGFLDYTYIDVEGKNKIIPMFNDGTVVYGYVFPEEGYYGPAGTLVGFVDMPSTYLLPIERTISLLEKDEDKVKLWNYLRKICRNFELGDLGMLGGYNPKLNFKTHVDDPYALITMCELYEQTKNVDYLNMARKIANNIVTNRFHRGFFVEEEYSLYSRLDSPELLSLITLDALIKNIDMSKMPYYLADAGYIHGYMLNNDGVTEDRNYTYKLIYTKTIYD